MKKNNLDLDFLDYDETENTEYSILDFLEDEKTEFFYREVLSVIDDGFLLGLRLQKYRVANKIIVKTGIWDREDRLVEKKTFSKRGNFHKEYDFKVFKEKAKEILEQLVYEIRNLTNINNQDNTEKIAPYALTAAEHLLQKFITNPFLRISELVDEDPSVALQKMLKADKAILIETLLDEIHLAKNSNIIDFLLDSYKSMKAYADTPNAKNQYFFFKNANGDENISVIIKLVLNKIIDAYAGVWALQSLNFIEEK